MLNVRDPALATPEPSTFDTGAGPVSTFVRVNADRALWTGVAPDDADSGFGAHLSLHRSPRAMLTPKMFHRVRWRNRARYATLRQRAALTTGPGATKPCTRCTLHRRGVDKKEEKNTGTSPRAMHALQRVNHFRSASMTADTYALVSVLCAAARRCARR